MIKYKKPIRKGMKTIDRKNKEQPIKLFNSRFGGDFYDHIYYRTDYPATQTISEVYNIINISRLCYSSIVCDNCYTANYFC